MLHVDNFESPLESIFVDKCRVEINRQVSEIELVLEFDFYPTKKGLEETVNICWQIHLFTVYDATLAGGQTQLKLQWMYGILAHLEPL